MIKKLIFDLDNTLIEWRPEYDTTVTPQCFKDLNLKYNDEIIEKVNNSINEYENYFDMFDKKIFIDKINKDCHLELPLDFMNLYFLNAIEYATPSSLAPEIIETLEYLNSKYELIVLTNWFENAQKYRLKKANILKYFSKVIGTEKIKMKPHKDGYLLAIGDNKIDECIMIGDSFKTDIKGALNIGLKSIYLTNEPIEIDNCICIKNLKELKDIL